jgi:hypothetical protein
MSTMSAGLRELEMHERQSAMIERAHREAIGYRVARSPRRSLRVWPNRHSS